MQALVRHGQDPSAAHRAVAEVPAGHHLLASRTSEQVSVDRPAPPSDAMLLAASVPTIPPGSTAHSGRAAYYGLTHIGAGGFGEVFQGMVEFSNGNTQKPFALKRALPSRKPGTDIEQHLEQQIRRLDALQREGRVYFSPTFNNGECLHLALLFDVAQVRNSDGDQEPLLVLHWADGPGTTLKGWLHKHRHADIAATLETRLGFAVQMCAGLRELHYGSARTPTAAAEPHGGATPLFVHQDLKPANILLFGSGGEDGGGPVRLALTDFGLTVQYNVHERNASSSTGGTAAYMAPEQWLGLPALSPGRDMWAAGMVLAQLFAGAATARALRTYRHYATKG